jgi:hypothetical protein
MSNVDKLVSKKKKTPQKTAFRKDFNTKWKRNGKKQCFLFMEELDWIGL